jgi:hypothetical protein
LEVDVLNSPDVAKLGPILGGVLCERGSERDPDRGVKKRKKGRDGGGAKDIHSFISV